MKDDVRRLHQLLREGTCCSAALVQLVLEARGLQNEPLLQAMRGLCGGVQNGLVCGALTGAACALSLVDPASATCTVPDLSEWFVARMGEAYGGSNCADIGAGDPLLKSQRCPAVVEETYLQMKAILESYGHSLS